MRALATAPSTWAVHPTLTSSTSLNSPPPAWVGLGGRPRRQRTAGRPAEGPVPRSLCTDAIAAHSQGEGGVLRCVCARVATVGLCCVQAGGGLRGAALLPGRWRCTPPRQRGAAGELSAAGVASRPSTPQLCHALKRQIDMKSSLEQGRLRRRES